MSVFTNNGKKAIYVLREIDSQGKVGRECGSAFLMVVKDYKENENPASGQLLVLNTTCDLSIANNSTIIAERYSQPINKAKKTRALTIDLKNIEHCDLDTSNTRIGFIRHDFGESDGVKSNHYFMFGNHTNPVEAFKKKSAYAVFYDNKTLREIEFKPDKNGTFKLTKPTHPKFNLKKAKGALVMWEVGLGWLSPTYDQVIGLLEYNDNDGCLYPVFFKEDTFTQVCSKPLLPYNQPDDNTQQSQSPPANQSNGTDTQQNSSPPANQSNGTDTQQNSSPPANQSNGTDTQQNSSPPANQSNGTDTQQNSSPPANQSNGTDTQQNSSPPANQSNGTDTQHNSISLPASVSQPDGNTQEHVKFSELCQKDGSVVQELALLLDRKSTVISYFRHLADKLNAPSDVKARCESNRSYSCTLEMIGLPSVASRLAKDLINALKAIQRNDMFDKLSQEIPESDKEKQIVEVLLESDQAHNQTLLNDLTSKLDKVPLSTAVKCWYDLGLKLSVNRDRLDLIKRGTNPSERLLVDYAYSEVESKKLKVGWLRQQMAKERLDRPDVVDLLNKLGITDDNDQRSMKDVFKPYTQEMWDLCVLLNKDNGGIKGWRRLAVVWGISHDIYSSFAPSAKVSPTEILFEWLNSCHPDVSVRQVYGHLESIKRMDARDKLNENFDKYINTRRQQPNSN